MLDLRRLRLLHELHARGTIAAVADALQFTPSAVSQQLAVLEREAGVPLLERAGPRRAADRRRARSSCATPRRCSSGPSSRRPSWPRPRAPSPGGGESPRSSRWRSAWPSPAMQALARGGARPALRARRGRARAGAARARARATSISSWPTNGSTSRARGSRAWTAMTCTATRSTSSCPRITRPRAAIARAVPLAELAGEAWTTGHPKRRLGGDDRPDLPRARRASTPTSATGPTTASPQPGPRRPRPGRHAAARARGPRDPSGRRRASHRRGPRAPNHLRRDPHGRCQAALRPGPPWSGSRRRRRPGVAGRQRLAARVCGYGEGSCARSSWPSAWRSSPRFRQGLRSRSTCPGSEHSRRCPRAATCSRTRSPAAATEACAASGGSRQSC